MKISRSKVLLLVMVMVLTTFAAGFTNYDGNDSYEYKTDGYGNSTWYFDAEGDKVDGPTNYWVKFFVSPDGMYLNYETNNMTLSDLSIKGGDAYRIYSGSELSGIDFRAPDNNGGQIPMISHYSFLVGEITPVPDMKYNVTVHKLITGETDLSLAGFEFELDGKKVTTNADGIAVFTGIEAGSYTLKELLSNAQKEMFEIPTDKTVVVVNKDMSVRFANTLKDVIPTLGTLTIQKAVSNPTGGEVNDTTEFKFDVEKYNSVTKLWEAIEGSPFTIAGGANKVLTLPLGGYRVTERLNANYDLVGDNGRMLRLNANDLTVFLQFVNKQKAVMPTLGTLTIQKAIYTLRGVELDDDTEFLFDVERYNPRTETWVALDDSPFTIAGGEEEALVLPLGRYRVTERLDPDYTLRGLNGRMLSLNVDDLEATLQFINIPDVVPTLGTLTIQKAISTPTGAEINDTTEFLFDVEKYNPSTQMWVAIDDSPFTIAGGENEVLELSLGRYKVTERLDPDYVLQGTNGRMLSLNRDSLTAFLQFVNEQRIIPEDWMGDIRVMKSVDDPNDTTPALNGFEFSLYQMINDKEVFVGKYSTDLDGEIEFSDLEEGHYVLYETNRAWFHEGIDTEGQMIHLNDVTAPNGYIEIEVENDRYYPEGWMGDIRVLKSVDDDRDDTPALNGFEFSLYQMIDDEELFVGKYATDVDGEIEFSDLEDGQYILYETDKAWFLEGIDAEGLIIDLDDETAPDGYIEIEVENDRYYSEDWMGDIRVVKTVDDRRDTTPSLAGFTFELFMIEDEDEVLVERITTTGTGIILFDDLGEGQYRLYEQNISDYIEGIARSGKLINLNPETTTNDLIVINVENERVYSTTNDRDDRDDRDDDRDYRDDIDDEDEDEAVLDIVVLPQPIPEAVPAPQPVIVVVEEQTPLATLPATGATDPSLLMGFGAALIGLGMLLKKKED